MGRVRKALSCAVILLLVGGNENAQSTGRTGDYR
jgi:hypothetical protein